MRYLHFFTLVVAVGAGCGDVVVDTSSGGGTGAGGATTTTGSSGNTTSSTGTGDGACPAIPPNDGDPCDAPGLACSMPLLCCSPTVTCSDGHWHVPPPACATPCISCGEASCSPAAVCVAQGSDGPPPPGGVHEHCAGNPCSPDQPLSCACASPLCGVSGCMSVMGATVICAPAF